MRQDLMQENLRDLFNKPASQMATPGAKAGDVVSAFTGKQAMEQAGARGEEMQSEMKGQALAGTKEKTEAAIESKGRVFEERSNVREEMHLADLAMKRGQFNEEIYFRNEQLGAQGKQANRAALISGIGAAIKLGSSYMVQNEIRKYSAGVTGLTGKIGDLIVTNQNLTKELLNTIDERKGTQNKAFQPGD